MTFNELDKSARYKVDGWPGIAFYIAGPVWTEQIDEDNDGDFIEYEYVINQDRVDVIMVGDDRRHDVECDDLTVISEDDYCSECGQIGCKADGR